MLTIIPDFIPDANIWNQAKKEGNYNKGRFGKSVKILVIHDTEGSTQSARAHFRDKRSQVSATYIIDQDGTIYYEVREEDTAYHAGVSAWGGYVNINDVSIGIELEYLSTDNGMYPTPQYNAVVELSRQIVKKYNIPRAMVTTHAKCAVPLGRKRDPRNFPWEQFLADVYSSSAPSPTPTPAPKPTPAPEPPDTTNQPPPKSEGADKFLIWILQAIQRWLGG